MKLKRQSSLKSKLPLIITGGVVAIALAGGGYIFRDELGLNRSEPTTNVTTSTEDKTIINTPPTEEEKKSGDNIKANLPDEKTDETPTPSDKPKTVTPAITSWGQVESKFEVAARVPGVIEDGGICTLTLEKGTKKVTGEKVASSNVSDVSCGYIPIPLAKLESGTWKASVSYKSAKASGSSKSQEVEVK